ncbi:MAG: hypothetical protein M3010_00085 [Candidatus Dormibacteraeota bacterium]|nr:hypothetical protein [Candidatus Dormibacteraeota bacterium]
MLRGLRGRVLGVVLVALAAFALTGAGLRLARTPAAPMVRISASESPSPTAGVAPAIASPAGGSLELDDGTGRRLVSNAADQVRAIGSVAKAMTALVVLEKYPLPPAESGPSYTVTAADVADYDATIAANGSNLPVSLGEQLSERQLLLGLLLPSANNLADTLARWTSGDEASFVIKLNARALSLGMAQTHFADASGFSPDTVSTATDLVRLGRAVLANPGLAELVATAKSPLPPDGAVYYNLDTLLGSTPGWLGIKTGETPSAGACLLYAARSTVVGGGSVLLVGAVLGQPHLGDALASARGSVETAGSGYLAVAWTAAPPALAGDLTTAWGAHAGVRLGALQLGPAAPGEPSAAGVGSSVLRRGDPLEVVSLPAAVGFPLEAGARVGTVEVRSPGGRVLVRWPVVVDRPLPGPSLSWRLLHG